MHAVEWEGRGDRHLDLAGGDERRLLAEQRGRADLVAALRARARALGGLEVDDGVDPRGRDAEPDREVDGPVAARVE